MKATTNMRIVRSRSLFVGLGEVEEDKAFLCLFFLAIFFAAALVLFLFFRSNATVKNLLSYQNGFTCGRQMSREKIGGNV